MNLISKDTITKIKESVNIVDVISEYVSLTPHGKNYFGICPFHDDNNPSMSVSPEKGIYKCFSCGATGSVFKFVQDFEKISFKEAVKKIADKAGIEVDIGQIKKTKTFPKLHEIYDLSLKFYTNNINIKEAKEAKNYLKERQITDKIIKEFEIGLSLNGGLSDALKKRFSEADIEKTGLSYKTDYGLNDLYHDRIMFPLYDLNGNVVAYSGRKYHKKDLENKELAKYINTRETDIFKKGNLLYNYHRAKNIARQKNEIIVMEGFMDVIRAHSIGFENVIATMGTAVTNIQASLIKKMAKEIILCFDGDEAGKKAALSCGEELLHLGVSPKVVVLEENLDPDEYILKKGARAFELKIKNAASFITFKLESLKENINFKNPEDLSLYINEVIKELNKINDDILREILIKQITKEIDIDEKFIKSKLISQKKPTKKPIKSVSSEKISKYELAQRNLLYHMLENPEVIKIYNNKVTYMPKKEYRMLAREITLFYKDNGYIDLSDLIDYTEGDEEVSKTINEVEKANLKKYTQEEIEDYVNVIKDYNVKTETKRLKEHLSKELDPLKQAVIAQKIIDLKKGV